MGSTVGFIKGIWRYPLKSMLGEELSGSQVSERGLKGDRQFALVDPETQKAIRAKQVPELFFYQAKLADDPADNGDTAISITMPDGSRIESSDKTAGARISQALCRNVILQKVSERNGGELPGFFDDSLIHLITTATLKSLTGLYPQGVFDPRRFRANFLIETNPDCTGFPEDGWLGKIIHIGQSLRLSITAHCARCVMTTHAQPGLEADSGILAAAVEHNYKNVGVYASILSPGFIKLGDQVSL